MIFEAIAAIKIANEAIGAIKEFAGHVESVGAMGKDLTKLADAKTEIEKKAADGDTEAFFALEEIKQQEYQIKQQFIYAGRPGLWDDYCKFIENRKMMRKKAEEREQAKKLAKRKAIKNGLIVTAGLVGAITLIGVVGYMVYWIVSLRGR